MRGFESTEAAQCGIVTAVSIVDGDMVVSAFVMRFNFKFMENLILNRNFKYLCCVQGKIRIFLYILDGRYQFDAMARSCCEVPDTFLPGRISMRIIGTEYLAVGSSDLVLATAFLTVVPILVQREPVMAGANVRSNGIAALLLTSTVVDSALVLI